MLGRWWEWCRQRKRVWTGFAIGFLALYLWARWGPMDPLFNGPRSTVALDRDGGLLGATVAGDGQWRFPGSGQVPEKFAVCLLQFEDRHFHDHWGVHLPSLVRAIRQNTAAGRTVSGGSTITMQVARMSHGPSERSYGAKLSEALLALRIETRYSKPEILALYTENAPFGGNVVGLDAAAWRWFGGSPDDLTWAESATLAVLPNAPSAIYPGKGQIALRAKRDRLLDRLLSIGTIDSLEWTLAKEEPLPAKPRPLPMNAPHLMATLMSQGHAGRRIATTIDGDLQRRAIEHCDRYAQRLAANEVHNAAAIIIDVPTGEVHAYIGNLSNSASDHAPQVDIVRAKRSTGSLLKPFLYADMLQCGELLPDMLLPDIPTQYDGFAPRNSDERYTGAAPASEALARSLNVPAVRALRQHGTARLLNTLRGMGFRSIDRPADHYGLSLIIGGAESNLWEIGGAYASMARVLSHFATGGNTYRRNDIHPPVVLLLDTGRYDATPADRPALSAASIHFTFTALREVNRPADEQGWKAFAGRERIAWKTGTSVGHRDAWAVGVSDRWCVAVWTGNATGEGRPGLTGTLAAAPLLFDLFGSLEKGSGFDVPYDELVRAAICPNSGHMASIDCPIADSAWIPAEGLRTKPCPYHRRIRVDEHENWRTTPEEGHDTAWFVLPPAMERYYAIGHPSYRPSPPFRDGQSQEGTIMEVLYPEGNGRLLIPTELDGTRGKAVVEAAHRDPGAVIHWDLDGTFMGSTSSDHRLAIDPDDGPHILTLTDGHGHSLRHSFVVTSRPKRP